MRCFQSPYGLVPAAHRLLIGLYIITPYIVSLDKLLGATTILTQGDTELLNKSRCHGKTRKALKVFN
jgi:hypothetical protein